MAHTLRSEDCRRASSGLTASGLNRHLLLIARAEDPSSEAKLTRSGADHVTLPAAIGADRIANLITRPSAEELLQRGEGLQLDLHIEELRLPASSLLVGKPVHLIEVGGNHGFLILGLVHPDGRVTVNPDDSVTLQVGDKVIVMGHANDLPELRRRYELDRQLYYRGARIGWTRLTKASGSSRGARCSRDGRLVRPLRDPSMNQDPA